MRALFTTAATNLSSSMPFCAAIRWSNFRNFLKPTCLALPAPLVQTCVEIKFLHLLDGVEVQEGHGRRTMSIIGTGKFFFEITPLVSRQNFAKIVFVMCSSL